MADAVASRQKSHASTGSEHHLSAMSPANAHMHWRCIGNISYLIPNLIVQTVHAHLGTHVDRYVALLHATDKCSSTTANAELEQAESNSHCPLRWRHGPEVQLGLQKVDLQSLALLTREQQCPSLVALPDPPKYAYFYL